jgi:hypothetical protein
LVVWSTDVNRCKRRYQQQAKPADRFEAKGKWPSAVAFKSAAADAAPPAYGRDLTHQVEPAERGNPDLLRPGRLCLIRACGAGKLSTACGAVSAISGPTSGLRHRRTDPAQANPDLPLGTSQRDDSAVSGSAASQLDILFPNFAGLRERAPPAACQRLFVETTAASKRFSKIRVVR